MEYPSLNTPPAGSIRFNTDSSKMEIYNGDKWWNIDSTSPAEQTGGTRGLFMGGSTGSQVNTIQYVTIDTIGNATDFGDMIDQLTETRVSGSRTRALGTGGYDGSNNFNYIQYAAFASTGDTVDFGDLLAAQRGSAVGSSQTRSIVAGGYVTPTNVNTIQYITIAQTGDAVDFGDYVNPDSSTLGGACSACSPTRMVIGGNGYDACSYLTISTLGNTSYFGNDTVTPGGPKGICSNATRGVFFHGDNNNTITYLTIATLGNLLDFGDTNVIGFNAAAAASSSTRAMAAGGWNNPGSGYEHSTYMSYVQIMTTGNAIDFGDLTAGTSSISGGSNGHGGLG